MAKPKAPESVDALWQVINALSLEADFEQFFRKAAEIAANLLGANSASLVTLNDNNQLEYKFCLGLNEADQTKFEGYTIANQQGVTGQALQTKKPVFVSDYPAHPKALDAFVELGMQANFIIPILVSNRAIGALAVSWINTVVTPPSDHNIILAETIASQIGLGLQRTQLEQRLSYRANHDDLTKLPSRGYFLSHLEECLASAKRHQRLYALMMIDLDGFKTVNDQVGHAIGDELLCTVALRLKSIIRGGDIVARLGGDEFVVLMEYQDWPDEPIGAAERILNQLHIQVPGTKDNLSVTPSIGIATYPQDSNSADMLLKNADIAMYQAKQLYGGNQVCLYNRDTAAMVHERKVMITNVANALKNDNLVIHYQPIIDTQNNQISAVEALVRWRLDDGSLRNAKDFITTIERYGPRLAVEVGRHVLRTAMLQILEWKRAGFSLNVTVNISAREFLEDDFLPSLELLLLEHVAFPTKHLILEVSEANALEDTTQASHIMNACRNLGVRFNIDNFGTGRASLSSLRELPIDFVKIDRSFIQGITQSKRDKTVLGAIQTLAKAYDTEVIAEGVETEEHKEILQAMGFHLMQGHYFSKAVSSEQLTEKLEAQIEA